MIHLLGRIFSFVLIFTIDVRVKAEEAKPAEVSKASAKQNDSHKKPQVNLNFKNIIQQPKNCIINQSKCAVFNQSNSFTLHVGESLVTLGEGAAVIRSSKDEIILVAGTIFVHAAETFQVNATNGYFKMEKGDALFEKNQEKVTATGISVDLLMLPRGHKAYYELPVGFSNWITPVSKKGQAEVGIAQTANLTWVIDSWAHLYEGKASTLKAQVADYKALWQLALENTGSWHKDMIDRRIAEVNAWRARMARLKALREAENASLRAIFRKRNYIE